MIVLLAPASRQDGTVDIDFSKVEPTDLPVILE